MAFVLVNLLPGLVAQSVDSRSTKPRLAFEVSSIRLNKSEGRPVSDFPIGPGRAYAPRGGVFRARRIVPLQYIGFAYKLTESQTTYLAANVPDWLLKDRFDVTASVEGTADEDQLRIMMQSLLQDRFKLKISKQDREVPVLALVLTKSGVTGRYLVPHSPDPPCPQKAPPAETQEIVPSGFPLPCHGMVVLPSSTPGRIRVGARDLSLSLIADQLSGLGVANLDRQLIDKTGLKGKYDFVLDYTLEVHDSFRPSEIPASDPSGLNFREALRDQLGLRLEPQKATVQMFVVDHIEHPSDN